MLGDRFGAHRVLEPLGSLPQPAWKLDNDLTRRFESEIHVAVETLNIDAASFRQMESASDGTDAGIAELVLRTVETRGKQHNPETGSGGMLLGRVDWVGSAARERGFSPGDRIATLASLSLTPLTLVRVRAVRRASAQLDVDGSAVVFLSAPLAPMPADFPDRLALALLDVAGAAPQVARHASPGECVIVLGAGGKSGLLCCVEARRRVGPSGMVVGIEESERFASELGSLEVCDAILRTDARDAYRVRESALAATAGREADLVISCVNAPGVEPTAILLARPRGRVYFFAMSTSFTAAALGAEGMGKDIDMYIGNGYAEGHAEHTLNLVRRSPHLHELLSRRYL